MSTFLLKRLASSPVLHFIAAGAAIFALVTAFGPVRDDDPEEEPGDSTRAREASSTIRVEREELIAFIQSRTRMAQALLMAPMFIRMFEND